MDITKLTRSTKQINCSR